MDIIREGHCDHVVNYFLKNRQRRASLCSRMCLPKVSNMTV